MCPGSLPEQQALQHHQQQQHHENAKLVQQLASSKQFLSVSDQQLAASNQELVLAREQIGCLAPQLEAVQAELAQLESLRKIQQRLQLQGQRRQSQRRWGGEQEQQQVSATQQAEAQHTQGMSIKIYTCFETRLLREKISRLECIVTHLEQRLAASAHELAAKHHHYDATSREEVTVTARLEALHTEVARWKHLFQMKHTLDLKQGEGALVDAPRARVSASTVSPAPPASLVFGRGIKVLEHQVVEHLACVQWQPLSDAEEERSAKERCQLELGVLQMQFEAAEVAAAKRIQEQQYIGAILQTRFETAQKEAQKETQHVCAHCQAKAGSTHARLSNQCVTRQESNISANTCNNAFTHPLNNASASLHLQEHGADLERMRQGACGNNYSTANEGGDCNEFSQDAHGPQRDSMVKDGEIVGEIMDDTEPHMNNQAGTFRQTPPRVHGLEPPFKNVIGCGTHGRGVGSLSHWGAGDDRGWRPMQNGANRCLPVGHDAGLRPSMPQLVQLLELREHFPALALPVWRGATLHRHMLQCMAGSVLGWGKVVGANANMMRYDPSLGVERPLPVAPSLMSWMQGSMLPNMHVQTMPLQTPIPMAGMTHSPMDFASTIGVDVHGPWAPSTMCETNCLRPTYEDSKNCRTSAESPETEQWCTDRGSKSDTPGSGYKSLAQRLDQNEGCGKWRDSRHHDVSHTSRVARKDTHEIAQVVCTMEQDTLQKYRVAELEAEPLKISANKCPSFAAVEAHDDQQTAQAVEQALSDSLGHDAAVVTVTDTLGITCDGRTLSCNTDSETLCNMSRGNKEATLQHTATRCTSQQHTATHCNKEAARAQPLGGSSSLEREQASVRTSRREREKEGTKRSDKRLNTLEIQLVELQEVALEFQLDAAEAEKARKSLQCQLAAFQATDKEEELQEQVYVRVYKFTYFS